MAKNKLFYIALMVSLSTIAQDGKSDSVSFVRSWTLDNNFTQTREKVVDTMLNDFQRFNPLYNYSVSYSYLSNIGTPALSNVFSHRSFPEDAFFLTPYQPYFIDARRAKYFNTTKPFSHLYYTTGGPNENREQTFEAVHTQNITPDFNFLLRYHVISSKGQYRYQQLKKNSFNISSNYLGKRYTVHTSFNINRDRHGENGGINREQFESGFIDTNTYLTEKAIPAVFNGSGNPQYKSNAQVRVRHYDLMIAQRVKLFTVASAVDTTNPGKAGNIAEPILSHIFHMERASRMYTHIRPNDSIFYTYSHFNYDNTSDSSALFTITNKLQLEFKSTFRGKVQTGIFGVIGNEYQKYHQFSEWDTTYNPADSLLNLVILENGDTIKGINRSHYNSNFFFEGGIYGNVMNRFKARFEGKLYFLGDRAGESVLKGHLSTNIDMLGRPFVVEAMAGIENKVPSFLLNNYYSNHFIWENLGLNPELRTRLSGKISAPSNRFELTGNYYLIRDHIFFNGDAIPSNYGAPLNIISFELNKSFRLWKFQIDNSVIYQISENENVLPVPDLVFFNSTYLDHTFYFASTGGKLQVMLGFDTYYTTSFEGYKYMPATGQFYVQDTENQRIGNYPIMDAFFSLKLKGTQFFVKAEHFYGRLTRQNFYSVIGYPYNRYALKFGFSWTFYD